MLAFLASATAGVALAQDLIYERSPSGETVVREVAPRYSLTEVSAQRGSVEGALPRDHARGILNGDGYILDSVRFDDYADDGALVNSSLQTFAETADGSARLNAYISSSYSGGDLVFRYGRRDSTYDANGRYTVTYFDLDVETGEWVGDYTAIYSSRPTNGEYIVTREPIDNPGRRLSSSHATYDTLRGVFAFDLLRRTQRAFFPGDTISYFESFQEIDTDRDDFFFSGYRRREHNDQPWDNGNYNASYYSRERSGDVLHRDDTTYTALSVDSLDGTGFYESRRGTLAGNVRVDSSTYLSAFDGFRADRRFYRTLNERSLSVRDSVVGRNISPEGDTTAYAQLIISSWLPDAERPVELTTFDLVGGEPVLRFRNRFHYSGTGASPAADVTASAGACADLHVTHLPAANTLAIAPPSGIADARARVIDLAGRTVASTTLTSRQSQLALPSGLASGLYAVDVVHAGGRCTRLVPLRR